MLHSPTDADAFVFRVRGNMLATISLDAVGQRPSLDPYLLLYDAADEIIAEDDDSGDGNEGYNALISETVLTPGLYRVEARECCEDGSGPYALRVTLTSAK